MLKTLIFPFAAAVVIAQLLAGCSFMTDDEGVFRDRKFDYRKDHEYPRMEVPEGMDDQAIEDVYPIPQLSEYADKDYIYSPPMPSTLLANSDVKVRIQKMDEQLWVLVASSPSELWPRLKQFLIKASLSVTVENGEVGLIDTVGGQGSYRFKVEQGFQRNSSEVYVRFLQAGNQSPGFWPTVSDDVALEQQMIEELARFFADVSENPSYSYIAQKISTQNKMFVRQNDKGEKRLVLTVPRERALASVQLALQKAEYEVKPFDAALSSYEVRYLPQLKGDKKPAWWRRLLFLGPPEYDDDIEYGGNRYRIQIQADGEFQLLTVQKLDEENQSGRQHRDEINRVIQLIQGYIT